MTVKVESIVVTITLATGQKRIIESRPDSINQNGIVVYEDVRIANDILAMPGGPVDMTKHTTVSWVEQWTEMS